MTDESHEKIRSENLISSNVHI